MNNPENNDLISIVIPVFNSEESLKIISESIFNVFDDLTFDFEIFFIDDASTNNNTQRILRSVQVMYPNKITVIKLKYNAGQHNAILCGLNFAKGEYVIVMDDDLQHDPYVIPKLLNKRSHDVVYADFGTKSGFNIRTIGSKIRYKILKIQNKKLKHINPSNFVLFNRRICNKILDIRSRYILLSSMIFSITDDAVNVSVERQDRYEGSSGYTVFSLFNLLRRSILFDPKIFLKYFSFRSIAAFVVGALFYFISQYFSQNFIFITTSCLFFIISFLLSLASLTIAINYKRYDESHHKHYEIEIVQN